MAAYPDRREDFIVYECDHPNCEDIDEVPADRERLPSRWTERRDGTHRCPAHADIWP